MAKLTGLLVLMVGVVVMTYAMPHRDGDFGGNSATRNATATGNAGGPVVSGIATSSTVANASEPRTFSPQAPFYTTAGPVETSVAPTAVIVTPVTSDVSGKRAFQPRPQDDDARRDLAQNIQKELKRVGCYENEATGTWGAGTKKAMAQFVDRVNATLPVEEPDYILLTLLQGHTGKACGKDCPSGQSAGAEGRCVPTSLLTAKTQRPAAVAQRDVKQRLPTRQADERRVATITQTENWSTRVVPSVAEARPAARVESSQMIAAAPVAPLPGRMAIGATRGEEASDVRAPLSTDQGSIPRTGPRTPRDVSDEPSVKASPATDDPNAAARKPVRQAAATPAAQDAGEDTDRSARRAARNGEPDVVRRPQRTGPVYVYRDPAPRYFAPASVYRAPPPPPRPVYSAAQRNWKHAIFNDITRLR